MIFIRYESFKGYLRSYPITAAIAFLCIVCFIITLIPAWGNKAYSFGMFVAITGIDPMGLTEPWRYVTSVFLHADFGHLFKNMMMLIIFAPPLEFVMKSRRYVWFYLLCGIGGNALSAVMSNIQGDGYHLSLGASGAIFGVFGAYFFLAMFRKQLLDTASIRTIYIILVISLITTFVTPMIDVWGHIGGFITGFMLYRFFDQLQMNKLKNR
ncbi:MULTISPECIES: rhomboid family intramembrane serine protease [Paenibacillus]|uniref:rhomboid family intramembrane serine protease n=1 Tax=Paenibacillus TaxID=44249 RepID=UPI00203DDFEB|nr:rhomboid family intramembrane serine protease [Paenibacillus camelliae]MCM3635443.1 rhomboid family intramembrane serine protease [Paenibacillus camelliae]